MNKIKFKQIAFPSSNKSFVKGDGSIDFNNYVILDENNKISKDVLPDSIIIKGITYGDYLISEYIPKIDEVIIVIDYIVVNNKSIPAFCIGNGINSLKNLPISGEYSKISQIADVAKKLEHSLIIGSHIFDGSKDVVIPIYDKEYNIK